MSRPVDARGLQQARAAVERSCSELVKVKAAGDLEAHSQREISFVLLVLQVRLNCGVWWHSLLRSARAMAEQVSVGLTFLHRQPSSPAWLTKRFCEVADWFSFFCLGLQTEKSFQKQTGVNLG